MKARSKAKQALATLALTAVLAATPIPTQAVSPNIPPPIGVSQEQWLTPPRGLTQEQWSSLPRRTRERVLEVLGNPGHENAEIYIEPGRPTVFIPFTGPRNEHHRPIEQRSFNLETGVSTLIGISWGPPASVPIINHYNIDLAVERQAMRDVDLIYINSRRAEQGFHPLSTNLVLMTASDRSHLISAQNSVLAAYLKLEHGIEGEFVPLELEMGTSGTFGIFPIFHDYDGNVYTHRGGGLHQRTPFTILKNEEVFSITPFFNIHDFRGPSFSSTVEERLISYRFTDPLFTHIGSVNRLNATGNFSGGAAILASIQE